MTETTWKRAASWAPLLLMLLAATVWAAVDQENYASIKRPSKAGGQGTTFPSALTANTGDDSTTWSATTPLTGQSFPTYRDPFVALHTRLSWPGATCCLAVGLRDDAGNFRGVADIITLTAPQGDHAAYDGTGYWTSTPGYFATNGWTTYEVRVLDVSSGTVTVLPVTVGATGAAAE